jgi:hypothetical protein
MAKNNQVKFRFKVNDVVEAQGARLKLIKQVVTQDGRPAYEAISPFAEKGAEPWLVGEWALEFCRKVRKFK